MRDNPGGGEPDPAKGVCRRCMKNSLFVLSCIGKRITEGRGSKAETAHSGCEGKGTTPSKKPKESGRRGSCEKDLVPTKSTECVQSLQ